MSTSITSATSSTTWATAAAAASSSSSAAGRQDRIPGHVKTAADALGMDPSEVMTSLKSGKSFFDIADAQGVSHDDLVAALKAGAPKELRESADADAKIEAMASAPGVGGPGGTGGPGGASGPGGRGGHHGPPPVSGTTGVLSGSLTKTQQSTLSALSDLLGTDSASLLGQLQSGTDLTDLLSAKGVTLDQLSSKLEEGLLIDTKA